MKESEKLYHQFTNFLNSVWNIVLIVFSIALGLLLVCGVLWAIICFVIVLGLVGIVALVVLFFIGVHLAYKKD